LEQSVPLEGILGVLLNVLWTLIWLNEPNKFAFGTQRGSEEGQDVQLYYLQISPSRPREAGG
jgi:hypothetical protein